MLLIFVSQAKPIYVSIDARADAGGGGGRSVKCTNEYLPAI